VSLGVCSDLFMSKMPLFIDSEGRLKRLSLSIS
jgi:hypothetical protein